jgi:hypothetical protein
LKETMHHAKEFCEISPSMQKLGAEDSKLPYAFAPPDHVMCLGDAVTLRKVPPQAMVYCNPSVLKVR